MSMNIFPKSFNTWFCILMCLITISKLYILLRKDKLKKILYCFNQSYLCKYKYIMREYVAKLLLRLNRYRPIINRYNEFFGIYSWGFESGLDLKMIQPAALPTDEVIPRITMWGSSSLHIKVKLYYVRFNLNLVTIYNTV